MNSGYRPRPPARVAPPRRPVVRNSSVARSAAGSAYRSTVARTGGSVVGTGILLGMILAAVIAIFLLETVYSSKMYPHVSVDGIPIGGQTMENARATLLAHTLGWQQQQLTLDVGDGSQNPVVTPQRFGTQYDVDSALRDAYAVGRNGPLYQQIYDQIVTLIGGHDVPVAVSYDAGAVQRYLTQLNAGIRRTPTPAEVGVHQGVVQIVRASTSGRQLDITAATGVVETALQQPQTSAMTIHIPTVLVVSAIDQTTAQVAVDRVRPLLSRPLTLSYGNLGSRWVIDPPALARLLTFMPLKTATGWQVQIGVNITKLKRALQGVARAVARPPHNAGFIVDPKHPDVLGISPDLPGTALDFGATAAAILDQLDNPTHSIYLPTQPVYARMDAARAATQGFDLEVASARLSWAGATPERAHNIGQAASRLDNLILAPKQVMTFTQVIGPLSAKGNYYPELNRVGASNISGAGGGVSQVASLLYQAALQAGLTVDLRQGATVYSHFSGPMGQDVQIAPGPHGTGSDLRLVNTTAHNVLIKTVMDSTPGSQSLTIYLYNQRAVAPTVQVSPEILHAHADGSVDVTIVRTISGGTSTQSSQTLTGHYAPLEAP